MKSLLIIVLVKVLIKSLKYSLIQFGTNWYHFCSLTHALIHLCIYSFIRVIKQGSLSMI